MTSTNDEQNHGKSKAVYADHTDEAITDGLADICLSKGMLLTDIRFKYNGSSVLLILRIGRSSEGPLVGFYGADTAYVALRKAQKDILGQRKRLKVDEWALQRLAGKGE